MAEHHPITTDVRLVIQTEAEGSTPRTTTVSALNSDIPSVHEIGNNGHATRPQADDVTGPARDNRLVITNGSKHVQQVVAAQDEDAGKVVLQAATSTNSLQASSEWLQNVRTQFTAIAGTQETLGVQEFCQVFEIKHPRFAERLFAELTRNPVDMDEGRVRLDDFIQQLETFDSSSPDDKLHLLFRVYDSDGNGELSRDEVTLLLEWCIQENCPKGDYCDVNQETVDVLAAALFQAMDPDSKGCIDFQGFKHALVENEDVWLNLTISVRRWLPVKTKKPSRIRTSCAYYFSRVYLQKKVRKIVFLLAFYLINGGLFAWNAVLYRDSNPWVIVARGFGMCLNFNSAVVMLPVMRHLLTWLRSTWLSSCLPLDQNVYIHKIIGITIAAQGLVHTGAHLVNIAIVTQDSSDTNSTASPLSELKYWEVLFTCKAGVGWIDPGLGYISGVVLFVVLCVMVLCSIPRVRRAGCFEVFYWTHALYILYWVFLILHGPNFWKWFAIPAALFLFEKLAGCQVIGFIRYGKTYMTRTRLLTSRVSHMVISRPEGFHFKPGDYVYVNVPDIASFEWHPFTISSAPENLDEISLHIRSAGNWTAKLYDYIESVKEVCQGPGWNTSGYVNEGFDTGSFQKLPGADVDLQQVKTEVIENTQESQNKQNKFRWKNVKVQVHLDGPYGTPTRRIFDTEHAVFIAGGIGVTPFASVLQSIMLRYKEKKQKCPQCEHSWCGNTPICLRKLRKVDFIWINRSYQCFEWFVEILQDLEREQKEVGTLGNFIDIHLYMTSAVSKRDLKGLGLQLALHRLATESNKDGMTGLETKTKPGRPKWDQVFEDIAKHKKGKVKVYLCGSPAIAKDVQRCCQKYKFDFTKESF